MVVVCQSLTRHTPSLCAGWRSAAKIAKPKITKRKPAPIIARAVNKHEASNIVALHQRTIRLRGTPLIVIVQHGCVWFIQQMEEFYITATARQALTVSDSKIARFKRDVKLDSGVNMR